jgi:hypothetical protein
MRSPSECEGALAHDQQDAVCRSRIDGQGRGKVMLNPEVGELF